MVREKPHMQRHRVVLHAHCCHHMAQHRPSRDGVAMGGILQCRTNVVPSWDIITMTGGNR